MSDFKGKKVILINASKGGTGVHEFSTPFAYVKYKEDGPFYVLDRLSTRGDRTGDNYTWNEKNMFLIKDDLFTFKIPNVSTKLSHLFEDIGYRHVPSEYDYLDITDKNDEISYLPKNRIERSEGDYFGTKLRQTVKIGSFFGKAIEPKGAEYFVNKYKFVYDAFILNKFDIKLVDGEDIRHWYLETRYHDGGGTLNKSCMRQQNDQHRFDIYCENPDKCKMAIVVLDGKLIGRALIWTLDEPKGVVYMDRIYYQSSYIENLFLRYARDHKMRTKNDGVSSRSRIYVKRDYGQSTTNPYMDSFMFFIRDDGKFFLSNSAYDRNDKRFPDYNEYRDY